MFVFDSKVATVRPFLLLGAAAHEQDYALLRSAGVTHILQVGAELRPSFPGRFEYERVSLEDSEQEDIIRHLPRCFKFIDSARRSPARRSTAGYSVDDTGCIAECEGAIATCCCGGGAAAAAAHAVRPTGGAAAGSSSRGSGGVVLVHCAAGMSRSATVVISYLMLSERLSYDAAFRDVKAARPCIYPNLGFLLQVWEWEEGGCECERWQRWSKERFVERLAEYRRAQAAAGLHPAVRVRLRPGSAGACGGAPARRDDSVYGGDTTAACAGAPGAAAATLAAPPGAVGPLAAAAPAAAAAMKVEARA